MTDLISRKHALRVAKDVEDGNVPVAMIVALIDAIPSADAVPTVIRAKTFMRKEDFDKWAEDIKKQNQNIVCIPCDAEVVSAVQGEWEFVDNEIFAGEYFCSICGKRAEVDLYGKWILSNYCPSCGARMYREDGEA